MVQCAKRRERSVQRCADLEMKPGSKRLRYSATNSDQRTRSPTASPVSTSLKSGNEQVTDDLAKALHDALLDILTNGLYPVHLGSIWMIMRLGNEMDDSRRTATEVLPQPLFATVFPVVSGSTKDVAVDLIEAKYTTQYKMFEKVLVDESFGGRETADTFLALERRYETPSEAISPYMSTHCIPKKILSVEEADKFVHTWELWLSNVQWSELYGAFVDALEPYSISGRIFRAVESSPQSQEGVQGATPRKLMEMREYQVIHPHHSAFLPSWGVARGACGSDSLRDSWVCLWDEITDGCADSGKESASALIITDIASCRDAVRLALDRGSDRESTFVTLRDRSIYDKNWKDLSSTSLPNLTFDAKDDEAALQGPS